MNIWTFSRSCLCLVLAFALSACSDGGAGLSFLDLDFGSNNTRRNMALVSAEMAGGRVKLVPPDGYCIDKRELQQNFAVLARCDSLGGRGGAENASLGLITVAVTPELGDVELASVLPELYPEGADVLSEESSNTLAIAQVTGSVPEGADPTHWRGLSRMSGQLVSVAVYAPVAGSLAQDDGKHVLTELNTRSIAASDALIEQATTETAQTAPGTGLMGNLRGLFNRKPLPE